MTIANTSSGTAQIIADVVGFFLPGTPTISGAFAGIAPTRLVDTRTYGGPIGNAYTVPVQAAGINGIPQNASGVWVNLTVTEPTTFGYFMARGYRAPWTFTSNLNFGDGQTIANMAWVPIGAEGKIEIQTILNQPMSIHWTAVPETSQVIVDVFGYTLP
ncbi:hypothetical protein [Arthrobacter sp. MMS18-M83]|uniref:hypothetical protein n=1 Tax=Arthrobacter sp. MMS18-M83 TaxID=2996261 RepID=UPI00227A9387|nr:hypothetical protein [Arthrobacter sp. MMS18-M83]WAH99393.1 hypothetical protein OW521_11560 [Arthrobacter sp. MMS18-M83]